MTTTKTQSYREKLIALTQALAEKNKRLANKHLINFAVHQYLHYKPNWHHKVIASTLERVERGELDRVIFQLPPRHGKSELASVLFPAWYMGRNPSKKIIAASYSSELAHDFGYQVRNLMQDLQYRAVFSTALREDSKAKGNWRTDKGGHYIAVGAGGAITGRGADVLIIDDPIKNREEADSSVYREKIYRWYTSTAYTRLHKGGAVILILTRWHDDDLAGRLLKGSDDWHLVSFPAIATEKEQHRNQGEALWPDKYSLPQLHRIKEAIQEDWSPLYQQSPIDLEHGEFKREWLRRYEKLPTRLKVRIIVDLASSEDKRADENAILVIGQAADRKRYVIKSWGDWNSEGRRFNPQEVIEKIYALADEYYELDETLSIHIETTSYQKTLQYWLKQYAQERRQKGERIYRLEEIKTPTTRSKDDKIRALISFFSNDMVFFPHGGTEELEQQVLRFPKGQRVDRLDTLAMDLDIEKKPRKHYQRLPQAKYSHGRITSFT